MPGGALQLEFPADDEFEEEEHLVWTVLQPTKFNKEVHMGWRLSVDELIQRERGAKEAAALLRL